MPAFLHCACVELYHLLMRFLGIDVGRRRVGLAISDASGTLARPLTTLTLARANEAVDRVAEVVQRLAGEDDGLTAVVVGLPARLDGTPTDTTAEIAAFITALGGRTAVPIVSEDERLTSHKAEQRLAVRERDFRKRKATLDAAAAAIILQDYLDRRR